MKSFLCTAIATAALVTSPAAAVLASGEMTRQADGQSHAQTAADFNSIETGRTAIERRADDEEKSSAASGGGFDIPRYRIASGGETFSTGSNFSLGGTIGQHEAGVMSGGNYTLVGGFWAGGAEASEPICPTPGDINCDGAVDGADLLILLSAWGECPDPDDCPADLNGSGVVDGADLLIMLSNWG